MGKPNRPRCTALLLLSALACAPPPAADRAPAPAGSGTADTALPAFLPDTIEAIRADYAPDGRVARFAVDAKMAEGGVVLEGATDQPRAHARLLRALDAAGLPVDDRIRILPDPQLGDRTFALVTISVGNLRSRPSHSAELATQAPLGTPLRLLDRDGGFYLAQVPDGYLAWIDAGGIHRLRATALDAHRTAERIVYLENAGLARSAPSTHAPPISDLVAGDILVTEGDSAGFFRVVFPDGRTGFVAGDEAAPYDEWLAGLQPTETALVATAMTLLGRPYLWGGTSPKGMDCSGFTKTVYLLNGMILPRDASQQVYAGELVDDVGDFSGLRPGDLLFFGRAATESSRERVVHVGMWIGGGRFIHSSGRVRISSMDPADPLYDDYNRGRYLRTKRILGHLGGVHLLEDDALYPVNGRFRPAATAGPAIRRRAAGH